MKIAFLMVDYTLSRGGERATANVAGGLAGQHEVSIISLYSNRPRAFFEYAKNIRIHVCHNRPNPAVSATGFLQKKRGEYSKVRQYLSRNPPDIVIGVGSYPSILLALSLSGRASYRAYAWEHSNYEALKGPWKLLRRLAYAKLQGIICLTEADASAYRKRYHPVFVIPNMLPFPVKEPQSQRPKNILSVGAFEQEKGFDLLIAAFKLVLKERQDWHLTLAGEGSLENQLKKQAADQVAGGRISIQKTIRNIQEAYDGAGIYALASRREGFGMVLLEAMAAGVPCISFNCPTGPGTLIVHEKNGILVPAEDVAALAKALLALMENAPKRIAIASEAHLSVQQFQPGKIIAQWQDFLEQQTILTHD